MPETSSKIPSAWLLLFFPIIMTVMGLVYLGHISPAFGGGHFYNHDPVYTYLFNGLTLLDGNPPDHIDHPGTPLQVLIALIVFIRWLIVDGGGGDVVSAAINNPEAYIYSVSIVLLAINVLADIYVGKKVFRASGSVVAAMLFQATPLVFRAVAVRGVYFSPEALLIAASLVLLGLLAPIFFAKNNNNNNVSPIAVGIVCGFGLALKLTFLPLLGLLLLLGSKKRIVMGVAFSVIGFLIFTLPAWPKFGEHIDWIMGLIVSSERYGAGEKTGINIDSIPENAAFLLWKYALFYIASIALAVVAVKSFLKNKKITDPEFVIPGVLFLVSIVGTALVLKHFSPRYLLPTSFITFAAITWIFRSSAMAGLEDAFKNRLLSYILGATVFFSIAVLFFNIGVIDKDRDEQKKDMAAIARVLDKYPNALLIGTHICTLPECGISHGLWHTPSMNARLQESLKNFVWHNIWTNKIHVAGSGWYPLDIIGRHIAEGREVLLLSRDYMPLRSYVLEPLVKNEDGNQGQSLYRVLGLSDTDCPELNYGKVKKRDRC